LIKAFFITTEKNLNNYEQIYLHAKNLALKYSFAVSTINHFKLKIILLHDSEKKIKHNVNEDLIIKIKNDRTPEECYVNIKINKEYIEIENDYCGSIPVYYSKNNSSICLSNLEHLIVKNINNDINNISFSNLFGYLFFGHFIWDETAWKNIYQILPDYCYKFCYSGKLTKKTYKGTVKKTNERINYSDKQVANDLFDLNKDLVLSYLKPFDEIILPLSSGYDSRMIFAALANSKLKYRLKCYTYGTKGSIDVESAKELCRIKNIYWENLDLYSENYLSKNNLKSHYEIFGSTLHMHGMYQINFIQKIKKKNNNSVFTSGFMTGVPAGQHINFLNIKDNKNLISKLELFDTSTFFNDIELKKIFTEINISKYKEKLKYRLDQAFNQFDGEIYQKSIMFDIWTRQRNFISYYPRLFNFYTRIVSPHMSKKYINFFMSLRKEHIVDRKCVELMFINHYKDIASIPSNSNTLKSLNNRYKTFLIKVSNRLNYYKIFNFFPTKYKLSYKRLDHSGIINSYSQFYFPILENDNKIIKILKLLKIYKKVLNLIKKAREQNISAYSKISAIQSIVWPFKRN